MTFVEDQFVEGVGRQACTAKHPAQPTPGYFTPHDVLMFVFLVFGHWRVLWHVMAMLVLQLSWFLRLVWLLFFLVSFAFCDVFRLCGTVLRRVWFL